MVNRFVIQPRDSTFESSKSCLMTPDLVSARKLTRQWFIKAHNRVKI
jgi:hypothetical protein